MKLKTCTIYTWGH